MFRYKNLVILFEWKWLAEKIFIEFDATLCYLKHFLVYRILHATFTGVNSHWRIAFDIFLYILIRTSNYCIGIGRNDLRSFKLEVFMLS